MLRAVPALLLAACVVHSAAAPDGPARTPVAESMDPVRALGEWQTSHGQVSIGVADDGRTLIGMWRYERDGKHEGHFEGLLTGNVLRFAWVEGPLVGEGWLAFAPDGSRFGGEWWAESTGPRTSGSKRLLARMTGTQGPRSPQLPSGGFTGTRGTRPDAGPPGAQ